MNPLKCAFGLSSGKFLGLIVRHLGIEIDPVKMMTIQPPKKISRSSRVSREHTFALSSPIWPVAASLSLAS